LNEERIEWFHSDENFVFEKYFGDSKFILFAFQKKERYQKENSNNIFRLFFNKRQKTLTSKIKSKFQILAKNSFFFRPQFSNSEDGQLRVSVI
jgi:hypothetical protein